MVNKVLMSNTFYYTSLILLLISSLFVLTKTTSAEQYYGPDFTKHFTGVSYRNMPATGSIAVWYQNSTDICMAQASSSNFLTVMPKEFCDQAIKDYWKDKNK